jgi:hypothetical protein
MNMRLDKAEEQMTKLLKNASLAFTLTKCTSNLFLGVRGHFVADIFHKSCEAFHDILKFFFNVLLVRIEPKSS